MYIRREKPIYIIIFLLLSMYLYGYKQGCSNLWNLLPTNHHTYWLLLRLYSTFLAKFYALLPSLAEVRTLVAVLWKADSVKWLFHHQRACNKKIYNVLKIEITSSLISYNCRDSMLLSWKFLYQRWAACGNSFKIEEKKIS